MAEIVRVISRSRDYLPALIFARRLDKLWRDGKNPCISSWSGPPHNHWFELSEQGKRISFIAAYACLDNELRIGFTNGMHRTRWLIHSGLEEIPVSIPPEEQAQWQKLGLLAAPVGDPQYLDLAKCKWRS